MAKLCGVVCAAGVALVILSGCATEYFSLAYWQKDASGQTSGVGFTRTGGATSVVLAGSLDDVAVRFRGVLSKLGMQAQVTTDAEGVKIAAVTRSGKQLSVTLKNDATNGNPSTKVQMEWRGGTDSELESQLLVLVGAAGR
jgi:hypothetical protein